MNILHISDFHYFERNDSDYRTRVEKLCNDVSNKAIDLIVFSGQGIQQWEAYRLASFNS